MVGRPGDREPVWGTAANAVAPGEPSATRHHEQALVQAALVGIPILACLPSDSRHPATVTGQEGSSSKDPPALAGWGVTRTSLGKYVAKTSQRVEARCLLVRRSAEFFDFRCFQAALNQHTSVAGWRFKHV